MFEVATAVNALYSAIGGIQNRADAANVLRPSRFGHCPMRLWKLNLEGVTSDPDPRRRWPALQGSYNESLIRMLLREAGAFVIAPPADDDDLSWQEPDPQVGIYPHVDGLIRWPQVGLDNWKFLELKYLRAQAHIDISMNGLLNDGEYGPQSVGYLGTAATLMRNYANAPHADQAWRDLHAMGIVPSGSLFMSTAKDPSTVRMLFSGMTRQAKYELEENRVLKGRTLKDGTVKGGGIKPLTEQQEAQIARRAVMRERFLANAEQLDFYFEELVFDTPEAQAIWQRILQLPQLVLGDEPPPPAHNVLLPEEEQHYECAYYCEVKEWCVDMTTARQFLGTIDQLERTNEVFERAAEPMGLME